MGRATFLRPARPGLARIRATLTDIAEPQRAWRWLAERGEIPASWVDDAGRRFVHDPGSHLDRDVPTRDPVIAPAAPYPSSVEECSLYASDVGGVRAAEGAARALVDRLAPWGAPQYHHVLWWTLERDDYGFASSDTRPWVNYSLPFAFNALYDAARGRARGLPTELFGRASLWADVWRELASAGARTPRDTEPAALRDRAFGELASPFEPLAHIEAAGYAALEWIGATGAVVLVAPRSDI